MTDIKFIYTIVRENGFVFSSNPFTIMDIELGVAEQWLEHNRAGDITNVLKRRRFTGFPDKNGKEIYEGDIIVNTGNESNPKEVDFFNGFWSMKSPGIRIVPDWSDTSDLEVIGNIYENPNLLQ